MRFESASACSVMDCKPADEVQATGLRTIFRRVPGIGSDELYRLFGTERSPSPAARASVPVGAAISRRIKQDRGVMRYSRARESPAVGDRRARALPHDPHPPSTRRTTLGIVFFLQLPFLGAMKGRDAAEKAARPCKHGCPCHTPNGKARPRRKVTGLRLRGDSRRNDTQKSVSARQTYWKPKGRLKSPLQDDRH